MQKVLIQANLRVALNAMENLVPRVCDVKKWPGFPKKALKPFKNTLPILLTGLLTFHSWMDPGAVQEFLF